MRASYAPPIVDCSSLQREGFARPARHRTTEIVVHKYGVPPLSFEGIAESFRSEPWSVASVTVPGGSVSRFVADWKARGYIPKGYVDKSHVPYHLVIDPDGRIGQFMPLIAKGSHAGKANGRSVAVCLLGDFEKHAATEDQLWALRSLLRWMFACPDLHRELRADQGPLRVVTHDQVRETPKGCPGKHLMWSLPDGRRQGPLVTAVEWAEGAADLIRQGLRSRT